MRKSIFATLTLVAALVATAPMLAVSRDADKGANRAPAAGVLNATGTITAVDSASNTLTVQVSGRDQVFLIDSSTRILGVGDKAAVSDLKIGQNVTVSYKSSGGAATALEIRVSS